MKSNGLQYGNQSEKRFSHFMYGSYKQKMFNICNGAPLVTQYSCSLWFNISLLARRWRGWCQEAPDFLDFLPTDHTLNISLKTNRFNAHNYSFYASALQNLVVSSLYIAMASSFGNYYRKRQTQNYDTRKPKLSHSHINFNIWVKSTA